MISKRETISVIVALVLIVMMGISLRQGVFSLSDVGAALSLVFLTTILGVLGWGFKKRIEMMFKGQTELKSEMDLVIKPLYLAFDENPANPSDPYSGLVHILSLPPDYWNTQNYQGSPDAVIVNSTIDIMRQHCELSQPQLRKLIARYLEIRRKRREYKEPYGSGKDKIYYDDAHKIIEELANSVKKRYSELIKATGRG